MLAAPLASAQDVTVTPDQGEVAPPAPSVPPPPPSVPPPSASPVPPPAAVAAPRPVAVPPEELVSDRSVGIHIGVNLGLFAFDVHQGHFYGFASGNAGIPLVTNGQVGAFAIGLGYSTPLSRPSESMWFMDFFLEALPGWWTSQGAPGAVVGLGGGMGFRYLHRSGFTAGFKVPVFGAAFSVESNVSSAQSVGFFYLFNGVALPIVSFGYRF
ncbi:MAG: hypothetical protein AB1938_25940 [Myxococcota bacterium]